MVDNKQKASTSQESSETQVFAQASPAQNAKSAEAEKNKVPMKYQVLVAGLAGAAATFGVLKYTGTYHRDLIVGSASVFGAVELASASLVGARVAGWMWGAPNPPLAKTIKVAAYALVGAAAWFTAGAVAHYTGIGPANDPFIQAMPRLMNWVGMDPPYSLNEKYRVPAGRQEAAISGTGMQIFTQPADVDNSNVAYTPPIVAPGQPFCVEAEADKPGDRGHRYYKIKLPVDTILQTHNGVKVLYSQVAARTGNPQLYVSGELGKTILDRGGKGCDGPFSDLRAPVVTAPAVATAQQATAATRPSTAARRHIPPALVHR